MTSPSIGGFFGFYMNFQRPPLPFVGNKLRWHRVLKPLVMQLKPHAVVFDAFGGSFAISRMIKNWRRDAVCICNDCQMYYRRRLEAVADTNRVLHEMRENGGYFVNEHYTKYDPETEKRLAAIVATGVDRETCERAFYMGNHNTPRAKVPGVDYSEADCEHWTDDLIIIDELLDERKARYYCRSCDLIVMDPPYMVRPKSWGYGDYIDETRKARAFCSAVIDCGSCGYWLFDTPCSDLVQLALGAGSVLMECTGARNRQRANEVMCVRNPSLLMDFAISGKTEHHDGDQPVQLSLF